MSYIEIILAVSVLALFIWLLALQARVKAIAKDVSDRASRSVVDDHRDSFWRLSNHFDALCAHLGVRVQTAPRETVVVKL